VEHVIHVFHGFLGSPEDFSFLRSDGVTLHDLTNLKSIEIHPEDTLVGYSMGGRVCLELASRVHFQIKKLVLLNAHTGLEEEEKENRARFEESVMNKLKTLSKEEFLSWWNDLPHLINPLTPRMIFTQRPMIYFKSISYLSKKITSPN
jgi:pimeloyl-ACP methyl ester carboxylesterase